MQYYKKKHLEIKKNSKQFQTTLQICQLLSLMRNNNPTEIDITKIIEDDEDDFEQNRSYMEITTEDLIGLEA